MIYYLVPYDHRTENPFEQKNFYFSGGYIRVTFQNHFANSIVNKCLYIIIFIVRISYQKFGGKFTK